MNVALTFKKVSSVLCHNHLFYIIIDYSDFIKDNWSFLFRIYSKNANLSNPPFFEIPHNPNQTWLPFTSQTL